MIVRATQAITALYSRFIYDCRQLASNRKEMAAISESYFRYRDLMHDQEVVRARLVKVFGILGVQSPEVTPEFAKLISHRPIESGEVRKELRIWEILESFLSALDGEGTVGEFRRFLLLLDMEATPQAVDSAIKAHPELFEERFHGDERRIALRSG